MKENSIWLFMVILNFLFGYLNIHENTVQTQLQISVDGISAVESTWEMEMSHCNVGSCSYFVFTPGCYLNIGLY